MKNTNQAIILFACMLFCGLLAETAIAQSSEDQIKIRVQTNENGNTKTFEKTYNSREEMLSDPEYKEFFGDNAPGFFHLKKGAASFSFDCGTDLKWIDSLRSSFMDSAVWSRSLRSDDQGNANSFFFHTDSIFGSKWLKLFQEGDEQEGFTFRLGKSLDELREQMKNLDGESDFDFYFFDRDEEGNQELKDEFIQRFRILSDGSDGSESKIIILRKKVILEDLSESDDELKKISNRKAEKLMLDDFSYYPNPSDGRFAIKFKVENDAPVAVRIYSVSGKEIYRESYESFSGTFRSDIDVSRHDKGLYLLEISLGNKVMNKKLLIE